MARRKKRNTNQKPPGSSRQRRMTSEKIADVRIWLDRMQVNAARASKLADRMSRDDLDESNDLFWALAKYAENVQESAVKLDDINKAIYPVMVEVDEATWTGLKGMRSRLAHAFWNIDPQILWSTVTELFPVLKSLLSSIVVVENPVSDNETVSVVLKTQRLLGLPDVEPGSTVQAGQHIVMLYFGHNGTVGVFRVGHQGTHRLMIHSNVDSKVSVYGRR